MNEAYTAAGQAMMGGVTRGVVGGANSVEQQRCFDSLLEHLGRNLAQIAEGVNRVNHFRNRLLNPKPESVGKDGNAQPNPSSVEGRLQGLIHQAGMIGDALHHAANDLERAA